MEIAYTENGVSKQRKATLDEEKEIIATQTETHAIYLKENAALLAKKIAKAALLDKLGITADEAALLLS